MAFRSVFPAILFIILSVLLVSACSETGNKKNKIYYVELVGFTYDSLRDRITEGIMGKVSYYKGNKLEILSENYVTPDFPELHYFRNAATMDKEIDPGTMKIRVAFGGTYSKDSISYSLQKFTYKDDKWVKTSDMGFIKATTTSTRTRRYAVFHFGNEIVNNIVTYTYN
jgi:hypothetical protein